MILKDYVNEVKMEDAKLAILEKQFPTFFITDQTKAQPVQINVNDPYFFATKKSRTGGGDITKMEFEVLKTPPSVETLRLTYPHIEENGRRGFVSYANTKPEAKDNQGLKHEFDVNSGNYYSLGHNTFLYPSTDLELLYFLWFYCPKFNNNAASNKEENPKYTFFMPEKVQASRKNELRATAATIALLDSLSEDQIAAVLKGSFLYVSDDAVANYNNLFDALTKGDDERKEKVNEMLNSLTPASKGKAKEVAESGGSDSFDLSEFIQSCLDNDKLKFVLQDTADEKSGWYKKGEKGGDKENEYMKVPIAKINPASTDQRIAFAEYLTLNTDLLDKLKRHFL